MVKIYITIFCFVILSGSYFFKDLRSTFFVELSSLAISAIQSWRGNGGLAQNLSLGDTGIETTLLQTVLKETTSSFTSTVTGYFGPLTHKSLLEFQRNNNIPETGIFDDNTRDFINQMYLKELCPHGTFPEDHVFSYVDKVKSLPDKYVPQALVDISSIVSSSGINCLTPETSKNIKDMFDTAKKEGINLRVTSGFRTHELQKYTFDYWMRLEGSKTFDEVAPAGHSEHQLGSAVDLTGESIQWKSVNPAFAKSKEFKWLNNNAHKYGFIMSYPEGKKDITGYAFEPWHWRYVGIDHAFKMAQNDLVYKEYLNIR